VKLQVDDYISASEIGEYLFCQRSWWLKLKRIQTSKPEVLKEGTVQHEVLVTQVQQVEIDEAAARGVA
jgi:hypothetical protein